MHLRIAASIAVRVARLTTGRAGSLCRRDFHPLDDYTKFQFFISFLLLVQHFLVTPHVGSATDLGALIKEALPTATGITASRPTNDAAFRITYSWTRP